MDKIILDNLKASGLEPKDLKIRAVGPPELAATGCPAGHYLGYVIPYFNITGEPISFYRVRFLSGDPKYRQPKGSQNHLYFPLSFMSCLKKAMKKFDKAFVIVVEGEKKAAAAVKMGFPTVSLGGVDSWRNNTIVLPEGTHLGPTYAKTGGIRAKLPPDAPPVTESLTLAEGMTSLVNLILNNDLYLMIVFDTDTPEGLKPEVQRSAAAFGYELRYKGIAVERIRQIVLPPEEDAKVGLDDFLISSGTKAFEALIKENFELHSAFPRHPNPRGFINAKLQKSRLTRKEAQNVSLAILTELDARGRRLRSRGASLPFYFDETNRRLMSAPLLQRHGEPMHESAWGNFLYQEFGLSIADHKIVTWLASQFTGEEPIEEVEPRRIFAPSNKPDEVVLQISDGQFAVVSGDSGNPLQIYNNGNVGILFEQDQVDPLDGDELLKEFTAQNRKKRVDPWWYKVLNDLSLRESRTQSRYGGHSQEMLTLLFYISPWLHRWRGMQLPVEIVIGEADSGKSSLYELRLRILTGRPFLRNAPTDLRDWHASVAASGGLHVTDNVQFTNKDIRQRVSDEICRIITEPDPHVEMRQLYTTSTLVRVPVNVTFAITSIQQPFFGADLIQRAAVFDLEAIRGHHDSQWVQHQIGKFGGRTSWVAHHLLVIHRFLKACVEDGSWDSEYNATHRLAHYEQSLLLMADILRIDGSWIASALQQNTEDLVSEADWAMEGLKAFVSTHRPEDPNQKFTFTSTDVAHWAQQNEDFSDNRQLTNARSLGRYIQAHRYIVERAAGIKEVGTRNNRKLYKLLPEKSP